MGFSFRDFFNKVSNNNRIFTSEEIKGMSTKEFSKHEKAIDYQMVNLGIPKNAELLGRDDVVFVNEYLRGDGTVVSAHFRSKPSGISISNANKNTSVKTYLENKSNIMTTDNVNKSIQKALTNEEKVFRLVSGMAESRLPIADANLQNALNDFVRAKKDKNAHIINSRLEIHNKELSNIMDKIGVPKTSKGVIYDSESELSKKLWNSHEMQSFFKNNRGDIFTGKIDTADMEFLIKNSFDNYLGIQHCKLCKPHITKDGYFNTFLIDYYDFNYRKQKDWKDWKNHINNLGYSLQEKGYLENHFVIYHIHEKIW